MWSSQHEGVPGPEGEGELIEHLRSEIGRKQKAEADVNAFVDQEKQNLQEAADEVCIADANARSK